jgi:hypothetical protein
MQEKKPIEKNAIFTGKNSPVFLLGLVMIFEIIFPSAVFSPNPLPNQMPPKQLEYDSLKNYDKKNILKISDINGPRIDEEAAFTVRISPLSPLPCTNLPKGAWIFLLLSYLSLLIFNLVYGLRRATKIQWFWEAVLTFAALFAWYVFDQCRTNVWFPMDVLKMGILVYALYIYFFNKKQTQPL